MRLPKTKEIPYGEGPRQKISVRTQSRKVRIQDLTTGTLYLLDPAIARLFAKALTYAAHHAEIIRIPGADHEQRPAEDQRLP